jgi:uncharacterized protein YndB with AHSA1/START domain
MASETDVVEHEVRIAAGPRTVFEYFTDPAKLLCWIGTAATLDPRPGGVCAIKLGGGRAIVGRFVEVEPYRRIAMMWQWARRREVEMPAQKDLVEIRLVPDGNETVVRLTHERLRAAPTRPKRRFRQADTPTPSRGSSDAKRARRVARVSRKTP